MEYTILMSKLRVLIVLGVLIAVFPYSGFPYVIKNILITLSGFIVIYLSYLLYQENIKEEIVKEVTFENFSENNDFTETETNSIDKKENGEEDTIKNKQEIL